MTLEEAQRLIRDPSISLPGHMFAAQVLVESADSTLDDLLACARHSFRNIAWMGSWALHQRTGRRGSIIVDADDWERYLQSR